MRMKTITIRLEDGIFNKIEERRGRKSKSDFYREILEYCLNIPEDNVNSHEYNRLQDEYNKLQHEYDKLQSEYNVLKSEYEALKTELQHRKAIEKIQDERIKDLQNNVGFLQLEYQKVSDRLMLPQPRKWWQVWK